MPVKADSDIPVETAEIPIGADLTQEVLAFWGRSFDVLNEDLADILAGREVDDNQDTLYLTRMDGRLVGTAHLTVCRADPSVGGLGEVATDPDFRGRGIAARICRTVWDDFSARDGRALFLGTANPAARSVYDRCGWQRITSSNVMVHMADDGLPGEFLERYVSGRRPVSIREGTPAERIPMILPIVTPHEWQMLDANAGIISTRYAVQKSCMGLYPRYQELPQNARGTWFAARTDDGHIVGLATARLLSPIECRVDGFVHTRVAKEWKHLMEITLEWARESGAIRIRADASRDDEEKIALFEASGLAIEGEGDGFALGDREVPSVVLATE